MREKVLNYNKLGIKVVPASYINVAGIKGEIVNIIGTTDIWFYSNAWSKLNQEGGGTPSDSHNYRLPIVFIGTNTGLEGNNYKWNTLEKMTETLKTLESNFNIFNELYNLENLITQASISSIIGYNYATIEEAFNAEIVKEPLPYNFPQIYVIDKSILQPYGEGNGNYIEIGTRYNPMVSPELYSIYPIVKKDLVSEEFPVINSFALQNCTLCFTNGEGILKSGKIQSLRISNSILKLWQDYGSFGSSKEVYLTAEREMTFTGCKQINNFYLYTNFNKENCNLYTNNSDLMLESSIDYYKPAATIRFSTIRNSRLKYSSLTLDSNTTYFDLLSKQERENTTVTADDTSLYINKESTQTIKEQTRLPIVFIGGNSNNFVNNRYWENYEKFIETIKIFNPNFDPYNLVGLEELMKSSSNGIQYYRGYNYATLDEAFEAERNKVPLPNNFPQIWYIDNSIMQTGNISIGNNVPCIKESYEIMLFTNNTSNTVMNYNLSNFTLVSIDNVGGSTTYNSNLNKNLIFKNMKFKLWSDVAFADENPVTIRLGCTDNIELRGCIQDGAFSLATNYFGSSQKNLMILDSHINLAKSQTPNNAIIKVYNSIVNESLRDYDSLLLFNSFFVDLSTTVNNPKNNTNSVYLSPVNILSGNSMPPYIKAYDDNGQSNIFTLPVVPKFIMQVLVVTDTNYSILQESDYSVSGSNITITNPTLSSGDRVKVLYGV